MSSLAPSDNARLAERRRTIERVRAKRIRRDALALESERAPVALMSGLDRLIRETELYREFVDIARGRRVTGYRKGTL